MRQAEEPRNNPSFVASFSKSQIAASLATALDFATVFSLVEMAHVWYVLATALGSSVGAFTNFLLNRHWSFQATHRRWPTQAARYFAVSGTSMALRASAVYALTEAGGFHYSVSVAIASVAIGLFFNFPMHRYFVFR